MTGREALNLATQRLQSCGEHDSRAARMLLQGALGVDSAALIAAISLPLGIDDENRFLAMLTRAEAGEPLQYVFGQWDFYGRTFLCDSRALIPRADTETLAEAAMETANCLAHPRVIDVGCGTGCIGITLKLECAQAQVTLCDMSGDALCLAAENARRLNADVSLLLADMRQPLPGGPYDIIVSNPPYINAADMRALPRAVAAFEPPLALYGGPDGQDYVRALAQRCQDSLSQGGSIFIEIGHDQADAALDILNKAMHNARAIPDLAGVRRVVAAMKEDSHA